MSEGSLEFVIPGDLQTPTGGYGYDRRIIGGLRALGWRVAVHALDAGFPHPSDTALAKARDLFARLPDRALVLIDGLASGAMPQVLETHGTRLRLLALVHHPLAAETGLDPALARALEQSEWRSLQAVRHVIVTSDATKRALAAYAVAPGRISVVEPGTDAAPLARPHRADALRMLCVAALIPRKGHDLLFEALAPLAHTRWSLVCAGSLTRSADTVQRLRAQLRRLGLTQRVTLAGEVDAATLGQLYRDADLFILPSRMEGYGMAVAEALAHGLPVIGTHTGAIAQLLGTRAGLLVEPGDTGRLREALARVLGEPALLTALRGGAAAVRGTLPDWSHCCERMSRILEQAAATGRGGSP
ncbi:MAG TPA: glycosyltransferase family 4 protein [Steroidobacteraceae bacterium]|nr:glycosyltransferase family 4 protein [Steroidobacteraceae bacterium]